MKVDRLVSIIMILLDKKRVSADELAETFEVSKRTIYRDIDSICIAGIPVRAVPGVGGGFEIMPGYKIDKNVFSTEDLSTLLMGLSGLTSVVHGQEIVHTLAKVKSFIPAQQAEAIAMKANQISIDVNPWMSNPSIKSSLEIVEKALHENLLISFSYVNHKGGLTHRKIESYQLVSKNGNWYLYGFCLSKMDYRTFKLSRMVNLSILEETYTPKDFPPPILDATEIAKPLQISITLRIHKSLMERLLDFCSYEQFQPDGEEHYLVQFPFIDRDYYYDMLLGFGEKCELIAPAEIREKLCQKIDSLRRIYA